jgi:hypothetical protein
MKKIKIITISIVVGTIILIGGLYGFFKEKKTTITLEDKIEAPANLVQNESSADAISEENIEQKDVVSETDANIQVAVVEKTTKSEEVIAKNEVVQEKTATSNYTFKISNKLVDFGYQSATNRKIDTIIVHSSYDALGSDVFSVSGIIKEFKEYGVSAHYLIGREGDVYRLVEDKNIAWHAGESKVPDGRTGVNSFSIGIELVNTKSDKFTADQYSALNKLIAQLKDKYEIKYVLGHKQIAPERKTDPWNIDWDKVKK